LGRPFCIGVALAFGGNAALCYIGADRGILSVWRIPMRRDGDHIQVSTEEASGGSTPHIVRYILGISLLLTILALSAIWMTGAANN
jgi:hypothetical protein